MPLVIDQGPLPQDGERVDASTFLEDWVSNTDVRGLDSSSFAESIQFVTSTTDEPAERRAALWFKRGEGQLYFRDYFDRSAVPRYGANANRYWMGLCPMRTFVVEADGQATQGGAMGFSKDGPGQSLLNSYWEDTLVRRIPSYTMDGSTLAGRPGVYVGIALESRATGAACPVVDWGFCDALFACGGSNVLRGAFACMRVSSVTEPYALHPRTAGFTGNDGFRDIAIVVNVNATVSPHLARVYKRPLTSWVR